MNVPEFLAILFVVGVMSTILFSSIIMTNDDELMEEIKKDEES